MVGEQIGVISFAVGMFPDAVGGGGAALLLLAERSKLEERGLEDTEQGFLGVGAQPLLRCGIGGQAIDLGVDVGPQRAIAAEIIEGRAGQKIAAIAQDIGMGEAGGQHAGGFAQAHLFDDLIDERADAIKPGDIGLRVLDRIDAVDAHEEGRDFLLPAFHLIDGIGVVTPAVMGEIALGLIFIEAAAELTLRCQCRRLKAGAQIGEFLLAAVEVFLLAGLADVVPLIGVVLEAEIGLLHGTAGQPELIASLEPAVEARGGRARIVRRPAETRRARYSQRTRGGEKTAASKHVNHKTLIL